MSKLNKKSVEDLVVKGKRVLVRCDFNIPLKEGVITNDNRIVAALPTIKKLIENGDKVVAIVRENCTKLSKLPNSQQIEVVSCNMDEYWKLTDKIEGTIDEADKRGTFGNDY